MSEPISINFKQYGFTVESLGPFTVDGILEEMGWVVEMFKDGPENEPVSGAFVTTLATLITAAVGYGRESVSEVVTS